VTPGLSRLPATFFVGCRIEGHQGVALDDLVYIMTHLARQAEADGFEKVFNAAEAATKAIEVRCSGWV